MSFSGIPMKQLLAAAALSLPLIVSPSAYTADQEMDFFTVTFENDVLFQEDGGYTNGLGVAWGYNDVESLNDEILPSWLAYLADKTYITNGGANKRYDIGYSIGQIMQTPIDITVSELVEEDAPYAGFLGWKSSLIAFDEHQVDEIGLIIGVVGPASGAEKSQKIIHKITDSDEPMGWDNQLENELVFRVDAKRIWRLADFSAGSTEFDIIGGAVGGIGNLRSDVGGAISLRWGQDLKNSFSSAAVIPARDPNPLGNSKNGWYVFANLGASYVANNIFIDGNTFKDSHSVDLIHEQATISAGAALTLNNWSFLISAVRGTDQYKTQSEFSRFGSFAVSYNFQ